MATIDFLSPAYLETIVAEADTLTSYDTPVLNAFFKRQVSAPNGFVKVPKEIFNYDDILPLIQRGGAIQASELITARDYTTYELKMFGDMKILSPKDIKDLVTQLENLTGVTYVQKKIELANQIVGEFNTKVNATREFMACSAMLGDIKDNEGNTIETFDIPASNQLPDQLISDGTVKSYQLLRLMRKQMRKATKYKGRVALLIGEQAYETIQDTAEFQAWANSTANNLSVEDIQNGVEGYFGDSRYPFIVADEFYYAKGTQTQFFESNSIAMAPTDAFAEFYGTIDTNDGSFSKVKHIDEWEEKNPDGTAYRLQCGAMPIVTLPNGIVIATLT